MFLEVNSLTKSFGGLVIAVNEGEIIGLIGPNGSGKTTLFNLISGVFKPERGEIKFRGRDITGLKPHKVCQNGIARTFQLTKPFTHMTALQNVMIGRLYGSDPVRSMSEAKGECERILEFIGLAQAIIVR